jgi:hypothetical protein
MLNVYWRRVAVRWAKSLMQKFVLCIAVLCLAVSLPSWAVDAEPEKAPAEKKEILDRLDAANGLFSEGKIRDAAAAYKALLREELKPPTWGKVTFNLGHRPYQTVRIR